MKKKTVPILVALVLIVVVGAALVGSYLVERFSYSKERLDLATHLDVEGQELAIVLQDDLLEEKALLRDGQCYFTLEQVGTMCSEVFYGDLQEQLLLHTDAVDTARAVFGEKAYENALGVINTDYVICFAEDQQIYVAADYAKLFSNFAYEVYDYHVQVYNQWGEKTVCDAVKATAVREKGGIKSPILVDVAQGEPLEILEKMDKWYKVKTKDSLIGYVEKKHLSEERTETEAPVLDYVMPEYTTNQLLERVSLGWHSIGGTGGNNTLDTVTAGTTGMNVIAPTWMSMVDNEGNIRNFGTKEYVDKAHNKGLFVWGVLDNFNYANENDVSIDVHGVLSSTGRRQHLVQKVMEQAQLLGMDGINVDFEGLTASVSKHYIQFLRELSLECRRQGLVLSIDNYVPMDFNSFYRLDIQGQIADYVIIMGYDEHWHGSGDPGSVASINFVTEGLNRTLEEVPAYKVVNAIPFYTILWQTKGAQITDEYVTMRKQDNLISAHNISPVWDEEACQNYAEWTEGDTGYRIWFEDKQSILAKLNVMISKNIAGLAVWRLGYEEQSIWSLLDTYTSLPLIE